jgi:protein-S-isoprenylcysteine O-methyltransferase Ste14
MLTLKSTQLNDSKPKPVEWVKWIVRIFALIAVIDGILFLVAGRLDWAGAWLLTFLYLVLLLVMVGWVMRNAPEVMEERSHMAKNVKGWDKVLMTIYTCALVGLLVVAALDAGRFRWTEMPVALQALGVLVSIPCGAWLLWVTRTNAYLSRFARIQDDRGLQVVTTGPYRYVRLPMYASMVPFLLSIALILGSWLALVPGAIIAVVMTIRTALEDRMLQEELPGYKEYAQRVRYRLIPGVW